MGGTVDGAKNASEVPVACPVVGRSKALGRESAAADSNGEEVVCPVKKYLLVLFAVGLGFARAPAAQATVTFNYDYTFSGTSPAGTAPWLTATFENLPQTDYVRLTMRTAGLVEAEFVSGWYFNLDPYVTPVHMSLAPTNPVPPDATPFLLSPPTGLNAYKAGGDGYYDIKFVFPTAFGPQRFSAGETVIVDFHAAGLTEDYFRSLSAPGGDSEFGPFLSAAHVQGIGESSGWVAPASPVPEPSTLLLLASGLVSLPFLRRRLRQ